MITFSLKSLQEKAEHRPKNYLKIVLSYGKVFGEYVFMDEKDHERLSKFFREGEPMEPSFLDMAQNLFKSLEGWAKNGFPVANEKLINKRRSICLSCSFWDNKARSGLGKCNHSKCGCTRIKWWLETEKCPAGKW